jgi:SMC interacting uncharacterized protein involved in chromosome segregation
MTPLIASLIRYERELSDVQQETARHAATLQQTRTEVNVLREKVAAQDLTPADVENMERERAALEAELSGLSATKEALARQVRAGGPMDTHWTGLDVIGSGSQ